MENIYIDPTLYIGRPALPRGGVEDKVYDLLDSLGIAYSRADHGPAMTIDDCGDIDRLLGVNMCKNLFLVNRQGTEFYLLMMPGGKQFKTKELSAQLGAARLSFASGEDMERLLATKPGSLSVLGLAFDTEKKVRLCADKALLEDEYIGCHPCVNTASLKIKTDDLINKFLPRAGHVLSKVVLSD